MTLEEIEHKPIIIETFPDDVAILYLNEHSPRGEFFRRGLCPHPESKSDAPPSAEFCGADRDVRSSLGHCTQHYLLAGD